MHRQQLRIVDLLQRAGDGLLPAVPHMGVRVKIAIRHRRADLRGCVLNSAIQFFHAAASREAFSFKLELVLHKAQFRK